MKKVKLVLIGAGGRGITYVKQGKKHCPEVELVAVADPNQHRRDHVKQMFGLPDECCFETWEELLKQPKVADAAIIATQDRAHYAPAMEAIRQGYHLLLEKPVAPTPEECFAISEAANEKGVRVVVCHVLRYTPFFGLIKKIIEEGRLGKIMNIIHVEGVGNLHHSHSFVRGDWHNSVESAPMILAKSCHDVDIIQWLLDDTCTRVHSFGSLQYFCRENKPDGAPEFCYQGCPVEKACPYSAIKLYRERQVPWFAVAATKRPSPTQEDIETLIRETNYGRCVFQCDNDVVDHQVVNLEYASGTTVSFTMSAFNYGGRKIRVMGTKGELEGQMDSDHVVLYDFATCRHETISIHDAVLDESIVSGHGGGDTGIIRAFCQMLAGTYTGNAISDITTSVENHLVAFAAEESRLRSKEIRIQEYKEQIGRALTAGKQ